jgi:two-component system NarL family sensor kinase
MSLISYSKYCIVCILLYATFCHAQQSGVDKIDFLIEESEKLLEQHEFTMALQQLNDALIISTKQNNYHAKALITQKMGNVFDEMGNYKYAMKLYYKTVELCEAHNLISLKGSVHLHMGITFFNMRQAESALNEYETCIRISKQINDTLLQIKSLNNIGNVYMTLLLDYETATTYFEKVVMQSIQLGYKEVAHAALSNLTQIYIYIGDISKAEIAYASLLQTGKEDAFTFFIQSNLFRAKNKMHEAIDALKKAFELSERNAELKQVILKDISDIYVNIGDFENALKFFKEFYGLRESHHNVETNRYVNELKMKYETSKKEQEISQLTQLKRETHRIMLLMTLGIILLLLLISYIMRNNRKRKTIVKQQAALAKQEIQNMKNEQLLIVAKATIKGEENERARIARDLHDGLGGLLSGLKLSMNTLYQTRDEGVVKNSFSNILPLLENSISELHKIAYNMMPDTLKKFGISEAIDTYCRSMELNNVKTNIIFQFFGHETRFSDVFELAVYRIAQELIVNAIKHAEATMITVQLVFDENRVCLSVNDNGKGFDIEATKCSHGSGLKNIQCRVETFGGRYEVSSDIGVGSETVIEFNNNSSNFIMYDTANDC